MRIIPLGDECQERGNSKEKIQITTTMIIIVITIAITITIMKSSPELIAATGVMRKKILVILECW